MVSTMSGIPLSKAQEILDALIEQQVCDPSGNLGSVSVGGRTVSYRSAEDLLKLINYWSRIVAEQTRRAAGSPRHSMKTARFS